MKVEDAMSAPVQAVRPYDSVHHARTEMISRGVSKLLVVDDDEALVGVITKSDVVLSSDYHLPPAKRLPLTDRLVEDVMTRHPWTVGPQAPLEDALEGMVSRNVSMAPVVSDEGILGLVTEADVVAAVGDWLRGRFRVQDLMSRDVETVHRHTTLSKVVQRMEETNTHQFPVREAEDTLVGIVTMSDVAFGRWFEPRVPHDKRITQTRKGSHAGRKNKRDVEEVNGVVEDAMTEGLRTIPPTSDASAAAHMLVDNGFNALPVVDGAAPESPEGRLAGVPLLGIITRSDVLRAAADYEGELRPLSSPQR